MKNKLGTSAETNRKIFIFIAIFVLQFSSLTSASKFCPNFCKCDVYENRNRADCSAQRLINAYVDLSSAVEVLDLSYNDIAVIDENCFENYRFLINLTIPHNDIHTIYLDAFLNLKRLVVIDLSYNRLEFIDERLFEANHVLQVLSLEGNKLMSLPSRPILRSTSLRSLNLRNAGINAIFPEMFIALPQLTELDLSQNLMITLSVAPFNAPKHLKLLLLDENAWNCDKTLVNALSIMRHRGITINIAECNAAYDKWLKQLPLRTTEAKNAQQSPPPTFERMKMLEDIEEEKDEEKDLSPEEQTTEAMALNWHPISIDDEKINEDTTSDDDLIDFANYIDGRKKSTDRLKLGVKVDEKLCEGSQESLCRRYRNCLEQVSHVIIRQLHDDVRESSRYSSNDMNLAFFIGTAVGVASAILIISCALCFKNCSDAKKYKNHNDIEAIYESVPVIHSENPPTTPFQAGSTSLQQNPSQPAAPFRTRRPRRTHRPHGRSTETAIVHSEYNGSDSFLSRLLGRPARHRYYRAGTATLIRCLSRTSLFNNNNLAQRQQSTDQTTSRLESDNPNSESELLRLDRPETPPPNYGDIVNKK